MNTTYQWVKYPQEVPPLNTKVRIRFNNGNEEEFGFAPLVKELYENGWEDVEWQKEMLDDMLNAPDNLMDAITNEHTDFDAVALFELNAPEPYNSLTQSGEDIRKEAIDFVDSLREYERESHTSLLRDERTSEELYNIFKGKSLSTLPPTANKEEEYVKICNEITRLQEKYDENGYACSPIIKLQRIEDSIDTSLRIYASRFKNLPTNKEGIDKEEDKSSNKGCMAAMGGNVQKCIYPNCPCVLIKEETVSKSILQEMCISAWTDGYRTHLHVINKAHSFKCYLEQNFPEEKDNTVTEDMGELLQIASKNLSLQLLESTQSGPYTKPAEQAAVDYEAEAEKEFPDVPRENEDDWEDYHRRVNYTTGLRHGYIRARQMDRKTASEYILGFVKYGFEKEYRMAGWDDSQMLACIDQYLTSLDKK